MKFYMPRGLLKEIKKALKVSAPTAIRAMRGETSHALAESIRKYAIEHGAIDVTNMADNKKK